MIYIINKKNWLKTGFTIKYSAIAFFLFLIPNILFAELPIPYTNEAEAVNYQNSDELEKASEKLYIEALKLFDNGNYWDAARNLIILLDFYPRYTKIDQVLFTLGDCLYETDLLEGSKKIFKYLVKKYITSDQLPRALLGLQRIEYDEGNLNKCLEFYKVITRGSPTADILDCSSYYAGLCYYNLQDYENSISVLIKIHKSNPYYGYGQYTAGLSYLKQKKVRLAVESFNNILKIPVINDDIRNIVDETYLTLGYIYYELGYNEHALNQFQSVSSKHEKYKDALLSAGWAATKMQNYERAIKPLTELVAFPDEDARIQEGFFLLGRCYLKLGLYDDALKVYEYLVNILPKKELVPAIVDQVKVGITSEEKNMEKTKMDLLVLETKLLDLIQLTPDTNAPDYLQNEKKEITKIRSTLLDRIKSERTTFDSMNKEMQKMKLAIAVKENRQDWRAFAEYGKSRAMFLKRTETKN